MYRNCNYNIRKVQNDYYFILKNKKDYAVEGIKVLIKKHELFYQ